jgi:hypothetical protein
MRGRTEGILALVTMGGPALGYALHGTLGAAVGVTWAVSGGGLLTVAAMLGTVAAIPAFWNYRAGTLAPAVRASRCA